MIITAVVAAHDLAGPVGLIIESDTGMVKPDTGMTAHLNTLSAWTGTMRRQCLTASFSFLGQGCRRHLSLQKQY